MRSAPSRGRYQAEEEEVVSDEGSEYGEQVVESWQDVIEEEPEDLEAAVTALIAVVYKGEDVDVERYVVTSFTCLGLSIFRSGAV